MKLGRGSRKRGGPGGYKTSSWDEGRGRRLPRFFAVLPELSGIGSRASEICVDLELLEVQGSFLLKKKKKKTQTLRGSFSSWGDFRVCILKSVDCFKGRVW